MHWDYPYFFVYIILLFVGPLISEIVGYFWHRFAEHQGVFTERIRYKHWIHHEKDYPTQSLRPREGYTSARSWSWYVLSAILVLLVYVAMPLRYSLPIILGGVVYGKFVVSAMHASFHRKNHWLNRFGWYKHFVYLHDIHHYKPMNFGINFFFMDKIFGTYTEKKAIKLEENFPSAPRKEFETRLRTTQS